jgi:hypothetical protein
LGDFSEEAFMFVRGCLIGWLALAIVPTAFAQDVTLDSLRCMDRCALDELFRSGKAVAPPVGYARGHILFFTDYYRHPRLSAAMSGAVWKGKHFNCDGSFVNQFCGVKALRSCVGAGPSWFDGAECVILEYPPGTPIFDDMRDEVREVGCGLFVSRLYNRYTCEFRGYIALVPQGCR